MITSNDFKTGMTIEYDKNIFQVIEFQHVKPGKGAAFVRSKLRNLRTKSVIDKTFRAGEKMSKAHIDKNKMQFLYENVDVFVFMNTENYEQLEINMSMLKYESNFLVPEMEVNILQYGNEILGVELPEKVILTVISADPGVKGNTASNATKNAIVETNYELQVPLFINVGDKLIISTKDGKYTSRS